MNLGTESLGMCREREASKGIIIMAKNIWPHSGEAGRGPMGREAAGKSKTKVK